MDGASIQAQVQLGEGRKEGNWRAQGPRSHRAELGPAQGLRPQGPGFPVLLQQAPAATNLISSGRPCPEISILLLARGLGHICKNLSITPRPQVYRLQAQAGNGEADTATPVLAPVSLTVPATKPVSHRTPVGTDHTSHHQPRAACSVSTLTWPDSPWHPPEKQILGSSGLEAK